MCVAHRDTLLTRMSFPLSVMTHDNGSQTRVSSSPLPTTGSIRKVQFSLPALPAPLFHQWRISLFWFPLEPVSPEGSGNNAILRGPVHEAIS